jgi:hypothetical protein
MIKLLCRRINARALRPVPVVAAAPVMERLGWSR